MITSTSKNVECLIIGSGFGGLCQAIKFKKANMENFLIVEKASSLGGTWRDNTYPGAACDIPSSLYSYSWEVSQTTWSCDYSGQSDILQYIQRVADKYDINRHIRFNQTVHCIKYREEEFVWDVLTEDGTLYESRFVVTAVGQLHHPKIPIFHGVEKFQGSMVHTAKFGSRQLRDYIDKNVAVIGSGASAVQLIPELQKVCKNVYVFQRTPNFIAPKLSLNPTLQKIINTFTFLKWLYRRVYLEQIGEIVLLGAINGTHWAKALLMAQCFDNMKQNIQDESLQKELTPTYPIGAKRILFSDDFYPALAKKNVHLITKGIKEIDSKKIFIVDSSQVEVDDIVYATGFVTNPFLYGMKVIGRGDKELWKDDQESHAHLGVNTHGFPNLFFLYGPNTNVGHTSILLFLEEQADFVIRSICHLNKKGYQVIEVKKRTEDAFTNEVKDRSEALPFTKVKESWYLSSRGRNTNNWVGSFREYKSRLENLNLSEDFVVDGEKVSEENSVEESLAKSIFLNTFKQQSFVACAIGLALFLSVKYPDH